MANWMCIVVGTIPTSTYIGSWTHKATMTSSSGLPTYLGTYLPAVCCGMHGNCIAYKVRGFGEVGMIICRL